MCTLTVTSTSKTSLHPQYKLKNQFRHVRLLISSLIKSSDIQRFTHSTVLHGTYYNWSLKHQNKIVYLNGCNLVKLLNTDHAWMQSAWTSFLKTQWLKLAKQEHMQWDAPARKRISHQKPRVFSTTYNLDVYAPSDLITFGVWIWLYLCQGRTFGNSRSTTLHRLSSQTSFRGRAWLIKTMRMMYGLCKCVNM